MPSDAVLNSVSINGARIASQDDIILTLTTIIHGLEIRHSFSRINIETRNGVLMFVTITVGETVYLMSGEGIEDPDGYFYPKIIKIPEMEISTSDGSGYMKIRWGDIAFTPDAFGGSLPDKAEMKISIGEYYADAETLCEGTILLKEVENRQLLYELWEPELDTKLLEEKNNLAGEPVPVPLVVGPVEYMTPVRTGTDTEQKYWKPDFTGTVGTEIHAFDDGVLINTQWNQDSDYIWRSVGIVGELTVSGTGNMTTLYDVFEWACTRLGLTLYDVHGADSTAVDGVWYSQEILTDWMGKLAYYHGFSFYIQDGGLYLLDISLHNGMRTIAYGDRGEIKYNWNKRIKKITAEWEVPSPQNTTEGRFMDVEQREIIVFDENRSIGTEESIDFLGNQAESAVDIRATAIMDRENLPLISFAIPLTFLPAMGEFLYFDDDKPGGISLAGYVRCENMSLNYKDRTLDISGKGVLD